MKRVSSLKRLVAVGLAGVALLILPACAGHKELKAPCSAALGSFFYWSGSAFASAGCGPMLEVNALLTPVPSASDILEN